MGQYTQLFLDLSLSFEMPQKHVNVIRSMVEDKCNYFGDKTDRIFKSTSSYFNGTAFSRFDFDKLHKEYKLTVLCDFKNYEESRERFLEFIKPYIITRGMIGFTRIDEYPEGTTLIMFEDDEYDYKYMK